MKSIFMGTPDFAVGALKALCSRHEVLAAVTQPDRPKGRGKAVQYTPVKETALELGIPVWQPEKVREPSFVEKLRELAPEVIVVAAFGQIIPESILSLPKYGCINIHASLLPKYRGAAPIQWAVIDGEKVSGVTIMKMDKGLDTGDMLLKTEVPLDAEETGGSLFDKLSEAGAQLLLQTLDGLETGSITPVPQPKESPTPYAAMLTRQMGEIDWKKSARELERLVRGLNPWPSAWTHLDGKMLKIWRACVMDPENTDSGPEPQTQKIPGTVVCVTKQGFGVQTGDGILMVRELQPEGKKRMPADAFLRGYSLKEGVSRCC